MIARSEVDLARLFMQIPVIVGKLISLSFKLLKLRRERWEEHIRRPL